MRDQKSKGKSQGRRTVNRQRAVDALAVTSAPAGNGTTVHGGGKRQLTRADDERVFYTTLRQAAANKNGRSNGRSKNGKGGNSRKRSTTNGAASNRKNSRNNRS